MEWVIDKSLLDFSLFTYIFILLRRIYKMYPIKWTVQGAGSQDVDKGKRDTTLQRGQGYRWRFQEVDKCDTL